MDWFSSDTSNFKQEKYEKVKESLTQAGTDEKIVEYAAKEIAFPPQKLEKTHIKPKIEKDRITFYFKREEDFDLVAKHFNINEYMGYNTHHIKLLINLLKEYEVK